MLKQQSTHNHIVVLVIAVLLVNENHLRKQNLGTIDILLYSSCTRHLVI
jgi:hypothetical protein